MKYRHWLLVVIAVNATGLFSGILEPDGALYGYIAKQMAQHNDFINLYNNTDWLDKPHLPSWITALSFKVFGITSFAYKLPAFLLWLVTLYYLYKLGEKLYNKPTAMVAVLIFATALQGVITLFDVRAEPFLTAFIIGSIYYLYQLYITQKTKYVLQAALYSACAILTKGLFFSVTICGGLGTMILVKKEWRQLINYRWYLYLLLTFLFIVPELYALYMQFDLHPEKIVYGKKGVSGIGFSCGTVNLEDFLTQVPSKAVAIGHFFFIRRCGLFYRGAFCCMRGDKNDQKANSYIQGNAMDSGWKCSDNVLNFFGIQVSVALLHSDFVSAFFVVMRRLYNE